MFALLFYIMMGLVCPSHSDTNADKKCKTNTTYNTTDDGDDDGGGEDDGGDDGPGGEEGDNPPDQ